MTRTPGMQFMNPRGHHNPAYFTITRLQMAADQCTKCNPGATSRTPIQKAGPRQKPLPPTTLHRETKGDLPARGGRKCQLSTSIFSGDRSIDRLRAASIDLYPWSSSSASLPFHPVAGVPSENCLCGRREDFLDRRLNQGRSCTSGVGQLRTCPKRQRRRMLPRLGRSSSRPMLQPSRPA